MRRAGKTTFLHQMRRERFEQGTTREQLPYVNFEDERLVDLAAAKLHVIVEAHYRRFPALRGRETVTWCFDEIQLVKGWERFIRRLLDTERVEIFLTGSSATMLSREIATSLRGRAWEVVMHPFSFEETLRHLGKPIPPRIDFLSAAERSNIEHTFHAWLITGGFPEAQEPVTATRHQLLHDYVDVAILRDVVERHHVSNIAGLRWMVRHLLGNAGSLFCVEKFYAALKS